MTKKLSHSCSSIPRLDSRPHRTNIICPAKMDYLFYDIFKEGKTLDDAPPALLRKESEFAWASTKSGETTRFFPSITDEENKVNGAVVHWRGIESPERAESIKQEVPWSRHGFSDAKVIPIGNFTSVSKLFQQGGKYLDCEPVQRLQPFSTDPCVTWYVIIVARDASSYDTMFGERDALHCVRLWKGKYQDICKRATFSFSSHDPPND